MSPLQAISICFLRKYGTFRGRARQSEFWWFLLFVGLVVGVIGWLLDTFINLGPEFPKSDYVGVSGPFQSLLIFVFLLPTLAVVVRRLHDRGHSGVWILLFATAALAFVPLILCVGGSQPDNRYGPTPVDVTVNGVPQGPHAQVIPGQNLQGQQFPQPGQQFPQSGQQVAPQGQQFPPQGQQFPPQGQQLPPQS